MTEKSRFIRIARQKFFLISTIYNTYDLFFQDDQTIYIYIYMLIKKLLIVNFTYSRFNPSNDKDILEATSDKAK